MVKQIDYIVDQRLNKLLPWLEYTLGAAPSHGVANQHHHGARRSPIAVVGAMPGYVTLKHGSVNLNLGISEAEALYSGIRYWIPNLRAGSLTRKLASLTCKHASPKLKPGFLILKRLPVLKDL